MNENQQEITKHYEDVKEIGKAKRELLGTIWIRKMNNFIKSVLIGKHVKDSETVLDIGCGKGGDLYKFAAQNILEYVGVDVSGNSVNNAKERHRKSSIRFRASFIEADAYNDLMDLGRVFDVISIQFSLHYAFASKKSLEICIENISSHLKAGGKLIATIPNSDVLLRRYMRYGNNYGNEFYRVMFFDSWEKVLSKDYKVGVAYKFTLQDSLDDCVEYIVDIEYLKKECLNKGLKIIEYTDFLTYFNNNVKKHFSLYKKTLNKKLNDKELKVCELYSIIVIKKVRDT